MAGPRDEQLSFSAAERIQAGVAIMDGLEPPPTMPLKRLETLLSRVDDEVERACRDGHPSAARLQQGLLREALLRTLRSLV
jgi:hypothetical protein